MNHLLGGLATNPALTPELRSLLVSLAVASADEALADALTERTDLTVAQAIALAASDGGAARGLAANGLLPAAEIDPAARPEVALALLDRGDGPAEWARFLAAHPDHEIRWQLASCSTLPLDAALALAADVDVQVVAELALWTTHPVVAGRLAAHPHAEVRSAAAANRATPAAALSALLTGEGLAAADSCLVCEREEIPFTHDPYCRRTDCALVGGAACAGGHESTVLDMYYRALDNPATPVEAALTLVDHPSTLVRRALAERIDLPEESYELLAEDPLGSIRLAVAGNPAIGERLIRRLAATAEGDLHALRSLARHPLLPLDVLIPMAERNRMGPGPLPRIRAATPDELAELTASARPGVRMLVAQRRDLPAHLRDVLADDPDASVAKAVASHPGLSEERLRAMVARYGVQVLAQVAANPDTPPALLEDLARHDPPVRRAFREVAAHPNATEAALLPCLRDPKAQAHAARHPALSPPVLVDLLTHASPDVAEAAAANPSLPRAAMEELVARGRRRV
ncbi:hypothetical protein ABZY44_17030 [Streptomyces sp. NPDC006544]|uniref:hypothetical protein n=1 Tax=Streptomyces sp. NPDC006544 TaxID=3154583 RepID=UPI00339E1950